MKIRISNYKFAHRIFKIIRFFWFNLVLKKKAWFLGMEGLDEDKNEEWGEPNLVDKYYLLWFE